MNIFPATLSQDGRKIPLIAGWQEKATDDPEQIAVWQELYRERITFWGIPVGVKNDLLVLDIDVKHEGKNGFESLKVNNLHVPDTQSQRTRSGGQHFFFKWPKDGQTRKNRIGFIPGIDLIATTWVAFHGLEHDATKPILEAPAWLAEGCVSTVSKIEGTPIKVSPEIAEGIIMTSLDNIREAPDGEGNQALNDEAFKIGRLVGTGSITEDFARAKLLEVSRERGRPDSESLATIDSAFKGSNNKPMTSPFSDVEPVPAFHIPEVPIDERWTPKYFTPFDLTNQAKLKKPQLFENWSSEDIHITTADGGTGKTTLKLQEAICLALGEPFLTFKCLQPGGKTLYITGEDTTEKLAAMIGMICKQMGIMDNTEKMNKVLGSIVVKKDSDLCVIAKDKQNFLEPNQLSLNKVLEAVYDIKPKMIVFDPIASFWGSEAALNDMAKAVNKFMGKLATEGQCCVEMINHMGKTSSTSKDMSQFAGRGGTGLPSNARVSRVMRAIDETEYVELMGKDIEEGESPVMININKFSDGSPLLNKPFLAVRKGFLFGHQTINKIKAQESKDGQDIGRLMGFMKEIIQSGKYPTKALAIGFFGSSQDKLSKDRVTNALAVLTFVGYKGQLLKEIDNPDATKSDKAYVLTDVHGTEI